MLPKPHLVPTRAERAPDGVWRLIVPACPICGKRHLHGGGTGDAPELGHRLAHCAGGQQGGGYVLVLAEEMGAVA